MKLTPNNYVFVAGIMECLTCYRYERPESVYRIGTPTSIAAAIARAESHEKDHHND